MNTTMTTGNLQEILRLADQKGLIPDRMTRIIASGIFADAFDEKADLSNREAWRAAFKLPPLTFLEIVGTITVPATTVPFVAKDKFISRQNGGDFYLGDDFKKWFLGKTEEPQEETVLRVSRLTRRSLDAPIRKELGQLEKIELSHFFAGLADKQSRGDFMWMFAYIVDVNGDMCAVSARWDGDGWGVDAYSVEDPREWLDDDHVLSRNS